MKRKNVRTIYSSEDSIIIEVIANGRRFIEYYVGVDKGNPFYYTLNRTESLTCRKVISDAFKGCSPYIEISKAKRPIDGAYLSFYRDGGIQNYPHLRNDRVYYGGAFYVTGVGVRTSELSIEDAYTMIKRLENVLYSKPTCALQVWGSVEESTNVFNHNFNHLQLGDSYFTIINGKVVEGELKLHPYGLGWGVMEYTVMVGNYHTPMIFKPSTGKLYKAKTTYLTKHKVKAYRELISQTVSLDVLDTYVELESKGF